MEPLSSWVLTNPKRATSTLPPHPDTPPWRVPLLCQGGCSTWPAHSSPPTSPPVTRPRMSAPSTPVSAVYRRWILAHPVFYNAWVDVRPLHAPRHRYHLKCQRNRHTTVHHNYQQRLVPCHTDCPYRHLLHERVVVMVDSNAPQRHSTGRKHQELNTIHMPRRNTNSRTTHARHNT